MGLIGKLEFSKLFWDVARQKNLESGNHLLAEICVRAQVFSSRDAESGEIYSRSLGVRFPKFSMKVSYFNMKQITVFHNLTSKVLRTGSRVGNGERSVTLV